jgi:hypothetical protein
MDELQTIRRDVVVLRGGSSESAGFGSRLRAGESRTGMQSEFGERSTRDGVGAGVEGSATRSEFDQGSTSSGLGTDVNDRGPVSGVDARSDTSIDARSTQPATQPRDTDATNGRDSTNGSTTPQSTNDEGLGLNNDASRPATPPQNGQPATGDQDQQGSDTNSNQDLPF